MKDLKELGYSYFAAETFSTRPGFEENSKLPNLNTGYYAMEPQFGNLIREANKLNYTLYPYEQLATRDQQERETGQAKNLARLLDSIPDSKVIVYCGFSHIGEETIANWATPMAAKLKELTGVDPYTIEQTVLSERSKRDLNNPYYNLINADDYAIIADKEGNPFNKKLDDKKIDAFLYSPPTKYIHNRPGWSFENGKAPFLLNPDSVKVTYPFLAKVYGKQKDIDEMAIPVDIIEIKSPNELAVTAMVVFKEEKFIIQLVDTKGATQVIIPQ
ncbi:MAG: hypothetical protein J7621_23855 [Niastella sp.]|nr:hypothetical protein [Niastella sp.]